MTHAQAAPIEYNPLIAITGLKRAGKDMLGGLIANGREYGVVSFADPLRSFAFDLFGITHDSRDAKIAGLGLTGRQLLQQVGTEVCRAIDSNFWLHSLAYRANDTYFNHRGGAYKGIVITDLRFENEARFVRENNGLIVHVTRPSLRTVDDAHVSEAGVPSSLIDYSICNDGTLEDFVKKADSFLDWAAQQAFRQSMEALYVKDPELSKA